MENKAKTTPQDELEQMRLKIAQLEESKEYFYQKSMKLESKLEAIKTLIKVI